MKHVWRAGIAAFALAALPGALVAGAPRGDLVYIGMHGPELRAARFDPATGALTLIGKVADVPRPTWAVADPIHRFLFVADEEGNDGTTSGKVMSFAIDRVTGALTPLSSQPAGGGGTTYLIYDPAAHMIIAANFGGSSVATLPVAADGTIGPVRSLIHETGSGPTPRQKSPHPHSAVVDPSGQWALICDLGADRIFVHRIDAAGQRLLPDDPAAPHAFAVAPGTGPRHIAFHPNGRLAFVADELTGGVQSFRWDAVHGRLTLLATLSTNSPEFTGTPSVAEMEVSRDGRFLTISNRGENTLVVYRIDAVTGALTLVQRVPCGGKGPWSFAVDPSGRWLLVSNVFSDAVNVFRVDPRTGHLTPTDNAIATPQPVSLTFVQ